MNAIEVANVRRSGDNSAPLEYIGANVLLIVHTTVLLSDDLMCAWSSI